MSRRSPWSGRLGLLLFLTAVLALAGNDSVAGANDEVRHVRQVEFHGTESLERKALVSVLSLRPSGRFRKIEFDSTLFVGDLDRVLRLYRAEGFFDARVSGLVDSLSVADDEVDLHITVAEGARLPLRDIQISVSGSAAHRDQALVGEVRKAWNLISGSPYRPLETARARRAVLRAARERGYLDATVRVEVRRRAGGVDVRARVRAGEPAVVRSIEITGLRKTQGRVVLREMELHPGDPLLPRLIEKSRRNLIQTGLFQNVELSTAPADSGIASKRVTVYAEDRKTGSLSSGFGYGLLDRFHLAATLEQENFGGRGIRLQLDGSYASRRRRVEGGAVFPWSFGQRITTRLNTGYEKALPRSFRSERWFAGFSLSRAVDTVYKGEVGYRFDRLDIRRTGIPLEKTRLGQLELALSRDSRTDLLGAPRGSYVRISEEWIAPWLGSREHYGRTKLQIRFDEAVGRLGFGARFLGGRLFPQDSGRPIPITERFFAGGASTLRGFRGDAVGPTDSLGVAQGGLTLALASAELELRVRGPVGIAVFVDGGQVANEAALFRLDQISIGAGIGLRARPRFGTFRADVGFPVTDRFADGPQFHFSTGTAFF
jgi:outer membrane protein insertion porin family